jgi:hypothetical protein
MNNNLAGPMIGAQPKQDVTPAMQHDAGQGAKKKPSDIIRAYLMATTGDQKVVNDTLRLIDAQAQKKTGRLVQFGNTVFWAVQKGQGVVDVHIFTTESPQTLVKRIKQAYDWAKKSGFKQVTSTLTDSGMVQLLQMTGLPYSLNQTTIQDGGKMVPAYKLQMQVQ